MRQTDIVKSQNPMVVRDERLSEIARAAFRDGYLPMMDFATARNGTFRPRQPSKLRLVR